MEETKKDINIHVSKNAVVYGLSIALVLVSAVAIGLAVDHEEHRNGREYAGEKFMGENTMHDDHKTSMEGTMSDMTTGMQGKTGKELEKAFLTEMIVHHQGAIDMAKILLQDKTISPELVKFANGIISAQEPEIKQMNEWMKRY